MNIPEPATKLRPGHTGDRGASAHVAGKEDNGLTLLAVSWQTEEIPAALATVGQYVEHGITRQIEWYYAKKRLTSVLSRGLRLLAIFCAGAGGLVPLAASAFPVLLNEQTSHWLNFGQLDYLLLALAAACAAADRFFGISTAWMRYMTTAMALEAIRERHRLGWTHQLARLRGRPPSGGEIDRLFQAAKETMFRAREHVQSETMAWVEEFQSNLAQLERKLHDQPSRPRRAA